MLSFSELKSPSSRLLESSSPSSFTVDFKIFFSLGALLTLFSLYSQLFYTHWDYSVSNFSLCCFRLLAFRFLLIEKFSHSLGPKENASNKFLSLCVIRYRENTQRHVNFFRMKIWNFNSKNLKSSKAWKIFFWDIWKWKISFTNLKMFF